MEQRQVGPATGIQQEDPPPVVRSTAQLSAVRQPLCLRRRKPRTAAYHQARSGNDGDVEMDQPEPRLYLSARLYAMAQQSLWRSGGGLRQLDQYRPQAGSERHARPAAEVRMVPPATDCRLQPAVLRCAQVWFPDLASSPAFRTEPAEPLRRQQVALVLAARLHCKCLRRRYSGV